MALKPNVIHLHLGLETPVRILHITDAHISIADEQDIEWCMDRAAVRREVFFKEGDRPERDPVAYLEEAMEYAKDFDCTVFTGDIMDHAFHGSEVIAQKVLAGKDYMFCAGNHELYKYIAPNEFTRDFSGVLDEVQTCFRGNLRMESRIVGGVNVVTVDNSHVVVWPKGVLDFLKAEVAKGLPILLFCHCPLNDSMRNPEYSFNPETGTEEQRMNCATSAQIVNYIAEEPLFKATFAGHYHFNTTESLNGKTTYILGGLFKGIVGEILID